MGFLLAATLINDSFQNWKEYPIKTTVESMAMKELIFPNITVCPPRDHFRNINYDLRQYKKLDFNMDTRNELLQSSLNILQQYIYKELLQNMSKVNDVLTPSVHGRYEALCYGTMLVSYNCLRAEEVG